MQLNSSATYLKRLRSPVTGTLGLLILTMLLVIWHSAGMNREFTVFPGTGVQHYPVSDQASGGESEATSHIEDGSLWLECTISPVADWPYCQIDFSFGSVYAAGLEGDAYDSIRLDIDYVSADDSGQVRIFIYSYEEAFSQEGQFSTLMPNRIAYVPNRYPGGLSLELDHFRPAAWWLSENPLPLIQQKTDFERIPLIQVTTGSPISPGKHRIRVNEVSLHGKWIPATLLYSGLMGLWMLNGLYWTASYILRLRKTLLIERQRREDLEELNIVLELSKQKLKVQASHDELTGLHNRRGLRDILYAAVKQASDHRLPFSIVFIDIDHFKTINDTYGHALGDEILKTFAKTLGETIRFQDTLVRWGGEEFLLLCPQTDREQARLLAEKLRRMIEQARWPHRGSLTCSFGVAQLQGDDTKTLIETADKALYQAKDNGRNRVVVATDEPENTPARLCG